MAIYHLALGSLPSFTLSARLLWAFVFWFGISNQAPGICLVISPAIKLGGFNVNPGLLNWELSICEYLTHCYKWKLLPASHPYPPSPSPPSLGLDLMNMIYINFNSEIL